jgi:cytochrome c oxidase assembly protein subunit 20
MDTLTSISVADLTSFHAKPCARESLLTGIGAGFGVGGLHFILAHKGAGPWQSRQWRAMSWAVGAFVLASGGAHAFCQRRRLLEKQAMARATAIMEQKRKQKKEEAERAREQRRLELEREEREGGLWKWVGWR